MKPLILKTLIMKPLILKTLIIQVNVKPLIFYINYSNINYKTIN